ncbi:MAG: hypothetical protein JWL77_6603 [Chthonomonadaceae bacterium]|nr:hypothetical protein [Chthonomonadaceae bacterium]
MKPGYLTLFLSALTLLPAVTSADEVGEDASGATKPPPPRITYGGYADFYYTYNLNRPAEGTNALRYPELSDQHGVHMGSLNVWMEGKRAPVGFRVDVGYGTSVNLGHFREPSKSDVIKHISQAYVSVNLDRSGSTYVDFGQWSSPAGVLSADRTNWFYDNDWFLCFAVPIYHTGARITHYFNKTDYLMAGLHRGWDATGDPHHDLGMIISGSEMVNPRLRLSGNYIGGAEHNGSGRSTWRHVGNLMLLWNQDTRWSHSFEGVYGQQEGVSTVPGHPKTIQWVGAAVTSKYTLNARQYVTAKAEWYREDSGFLLGFRGNMTSLAVNYTRIVNDHLQLRYEYRHDFADGAKPFSDRANGAFTGQQGTFVISAIVGF